MDNATAHCWPSFVSILYPGPVAASLVFDQAAPSYFRDLHLDRIVEAATANHGGEDLAPFFYTPLRDPDAVAYRQEVMRDLEDGQLMEAVQAFGRRMQAMRDQLAGIDKLYCKSGKERWFLEAVAIYCDAVGRLAQALQITCPPESRGMCALREYVESYIASPAFTQLALDARALVVSLANISYCLRIKGNSVTVRLYNGEADYSRVVAGIFEKFRRSEGKDYRARFGHRATLNQVEEQILDRVALLFPEQFHALETYCAKHADFLDECIVRFDREVSFYVAWLSYIRRFRAAGLDFCYPELFAASKEVEADSAFDLALAGKLLDEGRLVVRNGFALRDPERLLVVSGPNQGGKTTFARMFGQLHYLASLGCPVPGCKARLFLFDRLFTHFEKEEDVASLRGKLKDDLVRIRTILDQATPDSLVVMNEVFASTTARDALYLSRRVMGTLSALDALGVYVTFLTELSMFDAKTVSMVGAVDPDDPAIRTFRIGRRAADGLAYAQAIARKHRVTGEWLRRRIPS